MRFFLYTLFLYSIVNSTYAVDSCLFEESGIAKLDTQTSLVLKLFTDAQFSPQFCEAVNVCEEFISQTVGGNKPKAIKKGCDIAKGYYDLSESNSRKNKAGDCGLSKEERASMALYTATGSDCFNRHLRGTDPKPEFKILVDTLNKALDKLPVYRGLVRRGANFPPNVRKKHVKGDSVSYESFTSTSTARGFSEGDQLIIYSVEGRPIMGFAGHIKEAEVLFKSNSKFKVLEVIKKERINYYVMKEITPGINTDTDDLKILDLIKRNQGKKAIGSPDVWKCPQNFKGNIKRNLPQKNIPGLEDFTELSN